MTRDAARASSGERGIALLAAAPIDTTPASY
jgi:hypothetical protein